MHFTVCTYILVTSDTCTAKPVCYSPPKCIIHHPSIRTRRLSKNIKVVLNEDIPCLLTLLFNCTIPLHCPLQLCAVTLLLITVLMRYPDKH